MPRHRITYSEIMEKALELVEEVGYRQFSLRELAAKLGVKPSSLYNHVQGIEEINTGIAIEAANRLNQKLQSVIEEALSCGKTAGSEEAAEGLENLQENGGVSSDSADCRDRAFMAAAFAYRSFAEENAQLYESLINMPRFDDEKTVSAGFYSFEPLRELIKSYGLSEKDNINFIRGLRSVMHGFVELCNSGFMHRGTVSRDDSYEAIIKQYLEVLKKGGC